MADFPFDLVGFDLDGTLVDSTADLAAAVNYALAAIGRAPLSVDAVRPMIGGGGRLMLQQALRATGGEQDLEALTPILIEYYDAHVADRTRAFPGVAEALTALAARGVTLAVVTSKRERPATKLLDLLGLRDHFTCVIGGDTVPALKPDPAPIRAMVRRCRPASAAAFVGDSAYDVGAARAAGIPCIVYSPASTYPPGADAAFHGYADLLPTLELLAR